MSVRGYYYSCDACGAFEPMAEAAKKGTTIRSCTSCEKFLAGAAGKMRLAQMLAPMSFIDMDGTYHHLSGRVAAFSDYQPDLRSRIAIVLISSKRALEGLNFCLSSLDRSSVACSSHESYNPANAMKELSRYRKKDFDRKCAPPLNIQPHPHTDLLFPLALAAFLVYGDCKFTTECLRRAHVSNPILYLLLTGKEFSITIEEHDQMKHLIQEGNWYYKRYHSTWKQPAVEAWLARTMDEVGRKACDAVDCRTVEEKVGMLKMCKGCKVWFYCGVECQRRDWKQGGHRKACIATKMRVQRLVDELEAAEVIEAEIEREAEKECFLSGLEYMP